MRTLLFLLIAGCEPKEPADRSNDPSAEADGGAGDRGGTDDTGCTPVDYYLDADHDGFGTGELLSACDPVDAADVDGDCDDANADVHPGRDDICNDVDDDCDLDFDEDATVAEYFLDADGDGYGVADAPTVEACAPPSGYGAAAGDCDDADPAVNPANVEDWTDGIDDNCDGVLEMETPVEVIGATGNGWDAPTAGTPELRILGVYEPGGADAVIDVLHDVPEAVVLVLYSYETTDWRVTETYPGTIQRIIVTGHSEDTTVDAPTGVPVDGYLASERWSSSAYDWEDGDTRVLVEKAEAETGLELTSFHGTYYTASFTISPATEWMDTSSYPHCSKKTAGVESGPPDATVLDPVLCAGVLKNSHVCVTVNGMSVDAYGLDAGDVCTVTTFTSTIADVYTATLAWSDEYVYTCVGMSGMLQRASLLTGRIEKAYVYCSGAAILDGQIYVRPTGSIGDASLYDTWADVQCGSPIATVTTSHASNMAIHDSILYSTEDKTDEFSWMDLGGSSSGSVTLEDYADWIFAIDVTDDGWFTFIGHYGITWHDAADGHFLDSLAVPKGGVRGLACTVL